METNDAQTLCLSDNVQLLVYTEILY